MTLRMSTQSSTVKDIKFKGNQEILTGSSLHQLHLREGYGVEDQIILKN